jgi:hypothetical protein
MTLQLSRHAGGTPGGNVLLEWLFSLSGHRERSDFPIFDSSDFSGEEGGVLFQSGAAGPTPR